MKKSTNPSEQVAQTTLYSFYRPHRRVQYTGELIDYKTGECFIPPSRTKQAFKDECDINNIMRQFKLTGMVNHIKLNAQAGTYEDLPPETSFQDALNTVIKAEHAFSTLPAKIRERFHNDPGKFLEFFGDPKNQDEAIALGLAKDNRPSPPPPSNTSQSGNSTKPTTLPDPQSNQSVNT